MSVPSRSRATVIGLGVRRSRRPATREGHAAVERRLVHVGASVRMALRIAPLLLLQRTWAVEAPTVHVPVDAPPRTAQALVPPVLPEQTAESAAATETALIGVVREFCIAGIANGLTDTAAAVRVAAIAVDDPWNGERFLWEEARTTWSLPGTPQLFFWLGESQIEGYLECHVLAFAGNHELLARQALDAIEQHAAANRFGSPEYDALPLAALGERGYVDRTWDAHGFSASIAEDRTDPQVTRLHVSVLARPVERADVSR